MANEPDEAAAAANVSSRLRDPHPLVAEALRTVSRKRTSYEGLLEPQPGRSLYLPVSPAMFHRAIRVADMLLKACETQGFPVEVPQKGRHELTITVLGQPLGIRLREALTQVRNPEDTWPRVRLQPAGRLELVIDEYLDDIRKRYADGKKRGKVEDQIPRFVEGLRKAAEVKRAESEARERRERDRLAAEQRQWEAEQRRRDEQRRGKELEEEAMRWQRSRLIREYLDAVRGATRDQDFELGADTDLGRWLAWAERYARALDPLEPVRHAPLRPAD